jgi:hypothetical protein
MKNTLSLCLLIFLGLSGCATQRIFLGGESNKDPDFQKSQAFWLGGEFQSRDLDAELICKENGVQKIESVQSFGDTLLGTLSFGLYSPRTIKIYCNKNAEYHIEKHFGQTLRSDITTMQSSLNSTIESLQSKIDELQGQMNKMQHNVESDVKDIDKKLKRPVNVKCGCGHGDPKKCSNIQIYDEKSCVNDIPKDADIQLIDQAPLPPQELDIPNTPTPNVNR